MPRNRCKIELQSSDDLGELGFVWVANTPQADSGSVAKYLKDNLGRFRTGLPRPFGEFSLEDLMELEMMGIYQERVDLATNGPDQIIMIHCTD